MVCITFSAADKIMQTLVSLCILMFLLCWMNNIVLTTTNACFQWTKQTQDSFPFEIQSLDVNWNLSLLWDEKLTNFIFRDPVIKILINCIEICRRLFVVLTANHRFQLFAIQNYVTRHFQFKTESLYSHLMSIFNF